MANSEIEIGSRVRLSDGTRWKIKDDNPIGVTGTVSDSYGWVDVDWDNCEWNSYLGCDEDLIVVECEE